MISTDHTNTLAVRLREGDLAAFNELYYQYNEPVFRNICKLIYPHEIAEDILQDVFLSLWEHRANLDPEKSVAGWLFVVSYHKSLNYLRQSVREAAEVKNAAEIISQTDHGNAQLEQYYDELLKTIHDAVEKLPLRKKEAFRLCKLEGRSYEEAGNILGVSTNTVREYIKSSNKLIRRYAGVESRTVFIVGAFDILLHLSS